VAPSGGSAAAVAAIFAGHRHWHRYGRPLFVSLPPFADSQDLKPSYGRISVGADRLRFKLDQAGPISKSAEDGPPY